MLTEVVATSPVVVGDGGATCSSNDRSAISTSSAAASSPASRVPLLNSPDLWLRSLTTADVPELKKLCKEWFPIDYPDAWYEDITSNVKFYSVACVLGQRIIGILVAEIRDYWTLPKEDNEILASTFSSSTRIGYILSLGVVREYRKNGVASFLLDSFLSRLSAPEYSDVRAVYLHVLTTNFPVRLSYICHLCSYKYPCGHRGHHFFFPLGHRILREPRLQFPPLLTVLLQY
jgi:ribosomal protein S18 acetylase RimI-like enzyme